MNTELHQLLEKEASLLEGKRKRLRIFHYLHVFLVEIPSNLIIVGIIISTVIGIIFPIFLGYSFIGGLVWFGLGWIPVPYELYNKYIKETVLPKIFSQINTSFKYQPEGLNLDPIKASGIFASSLFSKAQRIEGEDLVEGVINDVKVSFNEVKFYSYPINWFKTLGLILLIILLLPLIIYLALRDSGDGISSGDGGFTFLVRDEINFYKGLFLHADFNKDFKGKVVVFPKALTDFGDKFSDLSPKNNVGAIRLENATLDEKYTVYASDEQLAYYLLSPSFIQSLFEIYSNENALPIVTFVDGQMFMTIPWEKDYFSVKLKTKVTGPEYFTKYINEINSFQKIVEHMNLDRRIWSKV